MQVRKTESLGINSETTSWHLQMVNTDSISTFDTYL